MRAAESAGADGRDGETSAHRRLQDEWNLGVQLESLSHIANEARKVAHVEDARRVRTSQAAQRARPRRALLGVRVAVVVPPLVMLAVVLALALVL
eukprot:3857978-Prymnesium_polylepis.1